MKTMNNYEAPVAEMIEMHMPVVLMDSIPVNTTGGTTGGGTTPGGAIS